MNGYSLTFPAENWARLQNRAEQASLTEDAYLRSAVQLGAIIINQFWENQSINQPTEVCIYQTGSDTRLVADTVDFNSGKTKQLEVYSRMLEFIDADKSSEITQDPDLEIDEATLAESEKLLSGIFEEEVIIKLDGEELETALLYSIALEIELIRFISWCIKIRNCHAISKSNKLLMFVNDAPNKSWTLIDI